MTPPFFASAFNWSSSRFRSLFDTAMQPECDSMIGAFDTAIASQNDFAEACDRSTIIPRRFISTTVFLPSSVKPLVRLARAGRGRQLVVGRVHERHVARAAVVERLQVGERSPIG